MSYLFAGFACILSALCYAEYSCEYPMAGGAFNFITVTFGEFAGWLVGIWFKSGGRIMVVGVCGVRVWVEGYQASSGALTTHIHTPGGGKFVYRVDGRQRCRGQGIQVSVIGCQLQTSADI